MSAPIDARPPVVVTFRPTAGAATGALITSVSAGARGRGWHLELRTHNPGPKAGQYTLDTLTIHLDREVRAAALAEALDWFQQIDGIAWQADFDDAVTRAEAGGR